MTMAKPKAKPKPKPKAKPKPTAKPKAAPPAPALLLVTADTISTAQIRYLDKEAKAAGDDPMRDECKVALDPAASAAKRRAAREICADLWNVLQQIAATK